MATSISPPIVKVTGKRVGDTLTAETGEWSVTGGTYATYEYQWLRCNKSGSGCVEIPGATSGTYKLTSDDVGYTIRVRISVIEHQLLHNRLSRRQLQECPSLAMESFV